MNKDKQRVAIATICGEDMRPITQATPLPDYLNDLNAIQHAWQRLGWEEKNECVEHLKEIVKEADCEVFFATAEQRAEAFLRTVGKWEAA